MTPKIPPSPSEMTFTINSCLFVTQISVIKFEKNHSISLTCRSDLMSEHMIYSTRYILPFLTMVSTLENRALKLEKKSMKDYLSAFDPATYWDDLTRGT